MLSVSSEAKLDIENIRDYYEQKDKSLVSKLEKELRSSFLKIKENPEMWSNKYSDMYEDKIIKTYFMKIFPLAIFYTISKKDISVIIIIGQKMDIENILL